MAGACLGDVVSGEGAKLLAHGQAGEGIEDGADLGEVEVTLEGDEVEALGGQGDEVETEETSGGFGGDAAIGLAAGDGGGDWEMAGEDAEVAFQAWGVDAGMLEEPVEQLATAGAFLAIDESDSLASEV